MMMKIMLSLASSYRSTVLLHYHFGWTTESILLLPSKLHLNLTRGQILVYRWISVGVTLNQPPLSPEKSQFSFHVIFKGDVDFLKRREMVDRQQKQAGSRSLWYWSRTPREVMWHQWPLSWPLFYQLNQLMRTEGDRQDGRLISCSWQAVSWQIFSIWLVRDSQSRLVRHSQESEKFSFWIWPYSNNHNNNYKTTDTTSEKRYSAE